MKKGKMKRVLSGRRVEPKKDRTKKAPGSTLRRSCLRGLSVKSAFLGGLVS